MGSQKRPAQLAFEWMALMNVYPVVLWVNYFFRSFWEQDCDGNPWSNWLLSYI
jgi:hypothetical protein